MRPPAPDRAPTAEGPTVAIEGRHADQGRDLLPRERPQLGEFQQQRAGTHGPNALGTLQQIVIFVGSSPRLRPVSEPDSKGLRALIDKHRIPCKILEIHTARRRNPCSWTSIVSKCCSVYQNSVSSIRYSVPSSLSCISNAETSTSCVPNVGHAVPA